MDSARAWVCVSLEPVCTLACTPSRPSGTGLCSTAAQCHTWPCTLLSAALSTPTAPCLPAPQSHALPVYWVFVCLCLWVTWSWESQFLGRLIRSLGSPRRRKGSRVLKEEKRTKVFFSSLKRRANDYTTKQLILLKGMFSLKLCTNDYITAMCPAWGHVSPSWEPSD